MAKHHHRPSKRGSYKTWLKKVASRKRRRLFKSMDLNDFQVRKITNYDWAIH